MPTKIDIKGVIISSDDKWIYDLFEIENTTAKMVNDQIALANGGDLEVVINSPGGDVFTGSEIYTVLKDYPGNVTVKIVGVAASAASVIAMAGNKTLISPTAQMMIHNASSISGGDYRDHQHSADFLRNWDKSITNAYTLKTGLSQEELLQLMDEETWLNAQQAKEKGFVDEIMFEDANQPKLVASAHAAQLIPQKVINKLRNEFKGFNSKEPLAKNIHDKEGEVRMNLEELKAQHPDLYNQIKNEGFNEGVQAENNRIKSIEDLQLPGNEDLVNKAKFETKATAEQLAVDIIKAQKAKGQNYLNNIKEDAKDLEDVPGDAAPDNNKVDDAENEKVANAMVNAAKNKRGVK